MECIIHRGDDPEACYLGLLPGTVCWELFRTLKTEEVPPQCLLPSRHATTSDHRAESPLHIAMRSIFVKTENERPRQYVVCVGKALSLAPDDVAVEDLIREFHTAGDLSKFLGMLEELRFPPRLHDSDVMTQTPRKS
ncbi:hypothetical protein BGZ63DRAFT_422076 [Mariannaea sp. PMI_226]|nr:hypothetical protein BGZ63DRAFT_422076 [Mariannaea sp. PMI_226]